MTADSAMPRTVSPPVIGVVCALHLEVRPLVDRLSDVQVQHGNGLTYRSGMLEECRVVIVEGGAGRKRARQATHALIDAHAPLWILSVGFSGALTSELAVGDIVVAESLIDQGGMNLISMTLSMSTEPERSLHVGRLCMADHIVRSVREKQELHDRTQALAVDMESHEVARVCRERRTQFMAMRVISDDMHEDLPREVLAIFGPQGALRLGALVGTVFKRPSSVKALWRIRGNAVRAARRLAEFSHSAIPQLIKPVEQQSVND